MMDRIPFEVSLFRDPSDRQRSQECLLILMDALARVNEKWLEWYPNTPLLYQSNVRYHFDPKEEDPWQDIPTTIQKGWGDCEDLACWRIAELRYHRKMDARPLIRWRRVSNRMVYHALVRYPNGATEDPSLSLGMRGPILRKPVFLDP